MKKLMIIPLVLLLSGCVTYYYPEGAVRDGVYYAQDDPAYADDQYVTGSAAYYTAGYPYIDDYPWASLDSFYLGYGAYGGGYGGAGWSFGLSYGFTPWYAPYYGYYSPWYAPYYPRFYGPYYSTWWPYYRSYHRRGYHHDYPGHGGSRYYRGHDGRYSRRDRRDNYYRGGTRGQPARRIERDRRDSREALKRDISRRTERDRETPALRRYVTTAPTAGARNRGMVIRSRAGAKHAPRRVQPPAGRSPRTAVLVPREANTASRSDYRTRQASGEVVYRAGAKLGKAHAAPVNGSSHTFELADTPATQFRDNNAGNQRGQAAGQVRYRRVAPAAARQAYDRGRAAAVSRNRQAPPAQASQAWSRREAPPVSSQPSNTGHYATAAPGRPHSGNGSSRRDRR